MARFAAVFDESIEVGTEQGPSFDAEGEDDALLGFGPEGEGGVEGFLAFGDELYGAQARVGFGHGLNEIVSLDEAEAAGGLIDDQAVGELGGAQTAGSESVIEDLGDGAGGLPQGCADASARIFYAAGGEQSRIHGEPFTARALWLRVEDAPEGAAEDLFLRSGGDAAGLEELTVEVEFAVEFVEVVAEDVGAEDEFFESADVGFGGVRADDVVPPEDGFEEG